MAKEVKGIIAGLVATIVLSILMLIKSAAGMLPEVNAIQMLAGIAGMPENLIVGWLLHFLIGAVLWGLLFVWIGTRLPGGRIVQGIEFGVLAWVLMMVIVFPVAGAGLFGLNIGPAAAIATLVLHIVYGAVLGWMYQTLETRQAAPGA